MKKWILCLVMAVTACVWTGCEGARDMARADPQPLSGFLKYPDLLIKQKPSFPFHYFYLKSDAGVYENVYVAPVNMEYLTKNTNWADVDQALATTMQSDLAQLAVFMQDTYKKAFATMKGPKNLTVVDSPKKPKTLVVSTALITIIPTKAELTILGTIGNFFLPGIGIITGHFAGGSITVECMIYDAQTGEIVAMYANTEKDQRAIINIAGMTWLNSAKHNIEKQAENTAKVFSGNDYTYTKRKLIKIIEI